MPPVSDSGESNNSALQNMDIGNSIAKKRAGSLFGDPDLLFYLLQDLALIQPFPDQFHSLRDKGGGFF